MSKYKKIVSTFMAILISLSIIYSTIPLASAKEFTDVSRKTLGDDFFDAINYVSDNGWIIGTSADKFTPYGVVTRAMFVTILYRYSGSKEKVAPRFSDVPSGSWYYYAVGWAAKHNIVSGITATEFSPNTTITREQALSILYRYATRYEYKTYSVSSFRPISAHPDYNSISSYAVEAVRWAKTYHILPFVDNTAYIYPKAALNRAYISLYLANYSLNVTGFRGSDRFGFINADNYFSNTYAMGTYAMNRLCQCINNYYRDTGGSESLATGDIRIIKSKVASKWKGSCLGMTMSVLLDKMGKIDFNRNFGNNAATMSAVAIPKNNVSTVESAINFYQLIQYTEINTEYDGGAQIYGTSISNKVDYIYKYFKDYGPCPFSYYWQDEDENGDECTKGHSVLLTDISFNSAANEYTLRIIDPNKVLTPRTAKITFSGKTATYSLSDTNYSIKLDDVGAYLKYDLSLYNYFDLDGAYNNTDYTKINCTAGDSEIEELTTIIDNEAVQTITLCLPFTAFQLVNAEGETLICDGQGLDGTMPVIDTRIVPTGVDAPADLILKVNKSDMLTYNNSSLSYTSFCVISDDRFASVSGEGIDNVIFTNTDNTLTVEGKSITYSVWLWTKSSDYDFYISGTSNGAFMLTADDDMITTTGLFGEYECGFSRTNSLDMIEAKSNLREGSSLDLSSINNGQVKIINGDTTDSILVLD